MLLVAHSVIYVIYLLSGTIPVPGSMDICVGVLNLFKLTMHYVGLLCGETTVCSKLTSKLYNLSKFASVSVRE